MTHARQALAALWLAGLAACAHVTPYYRGGQARHADAVDDEAIDHRLLLIGDAGDPDPAGEPTLVALAQQINLLPRRTTVVFLGDNVYERGMPDPAPDDPAGDAASEVADAVLLNVFETRTEAERQIDAQIDVVRGNKAKAIFIPGNHDWDQFELGGWQRIRNQQDFIEQKAASDQLDIAMLPKGGCPGPVSVPLGQRGELIILDTQWFLETRADGKPTIDNNPTGCAYATEGAVRDAFIAMLEQAARNGRQSIVAAHHPMRSEGPHGGYVDPLTHLFPFQIVRHYVPPYIEWLPVPVLGSIVVGLRACCSPSAQDIPNGRNRHMRKSMSNSMIQAQRHGARPLAYAAGHDHSLQVFTSDEGPEYLLVSGLGSASRASDVGHDDATLFAHANSAHPGFMQVDFLRDGRVRLAVIQAVPAVGDAAPPPPAEVFSLFMRDDAKRASLSPAQRP